MNDRRALWDGALVGDMSEDLPVVDPSELDGGDVDGGGHDGGDGGDRHAGDRDATVAGVVLAAGTGSRFGEDNKLLATLEGEPLVRRATRTLLDAAVEFESVTAVVGHEASRVTAALDGLDVEVVENPAYEVGRSTSIRAGIETVAGADAALFALGDVPLVRPGTIETLVEAYRAGAGAVLAAAHEGRRGNPVLFDAAAFEDLAELEGDAGGRAVILGRDDAALVETDDPGVLLDVDTPADLAALE